MFGTSLPTLSPLGYVTLSVGVGLAFGVLPGTVGCIPATKTVKAIIDERALLDGRMVCYDALEMEFDTVEITKKDDCPVCGDEPAIDPVHDVEYTAPCAIGSSPEADPELSMD